MVIFNKYVSLREGMSCCFSGEIATVSLLHTPIFACGNQGWNGLDHPYGVALFLEHFGAFLRDHPILPEIPSVYTLDTYYNVYIIYIY